MKICIDPGHGGADPGCQGFGKVEKNLNLEYAIMLKNELEKFNDVQVIMTRIDDSNPSLSQRTQLANNEKCDLFLSCHLNAYNGEARGTETIYSIYATQTFINFAGDMGHYLATTLGVPFRRAFSKRGNNGDYYGVIRMTKMPAMIIEGLFLDNELDNKRYNPYILSESIAEILKQQYNLTYKSISAENTGFYRVIAGSYKDKNNATRQVEKLHEKGFDAFIVKI